MTEHTRISPDGGLNLPREEIEREGWTPETELEVVHTDGGILIRPKQPGLVETAPIDWDEFHRIVPPHEGPPVSLEEMNRAIDIAMAERWKAKEARSR